MPPIVSTTAAGGKHSPTYLRVSLPLWVDATANHRTRDCAFRARMGWALEEQTLVCFARKQSYSIIRRLHAGYRTRITRRPPSRKIPRRNPQENMFRLGTKLRQNARTCEKRRERSICGGACLRVAVKCPTPVLLLGWSNPSLRCPRC